MNQSRVLHFVPTPMQGPPGLLVLLAALRSCRALVANGARRPQASACWLTHHGRDNMLDAARLSCSKTTLAEELQDTGRELKSCKGLGGGKVGTSIIPFPGNHFTRKAMAASGRATEHLCPPKGHLPKTMDRVHEGTGFSSILSGTKPSTGLQLVEPHHQIPF